ncbi:methyltransferase family protein [Rehaibacterium terrae]|jgi:protein-S-isoprenylcysteine O-methyltransferase Ste14|uniref:Protein-S-isoprenylcysteine O-methyltransferase Ste14 n=1 Tax=Rehaibacterium terrae TaxID=1341696 RepID=A0A7W8DE40_9GAMM|nr:isoprenylcysteine carboxylmethyltransferase family protein [Rehaibacterium terrae]MBB5015497.1 protein-S-isoprenylcysteine O-methyltransferase Ste14 [Rehaibacterium terrae]MDX5408767.1 isoprenylcysteine carboxylmethyltransferase family protein [Thauera sp.]
MSEHDNDSDDATPGVRFPPPLIFLLGLLAGIGLEYMLFDWTLVRPERLFWLRLLALGFAAAAAWLLVAALGGFRRQGNDPRPWREDSALVVEGIYRHTRNPMYVGMALAYVAIATWLNTLWPLLTLGPVLFAIRHYVIAREEAYLERRFGEAYRDYCRRVRRWM